MTYDPAFMNAATSPLLLANAAFCATAVTPSMLAENCSFLEVADLLLFGDLPTSDDWNNWVTEIDIGYADGASGAVRTGKSGAGRD